MEYRIIHNPEFSIVGFSKKVTLQFKGINPQIDDLTAKLTPEHIAELKSLSNMEPRGMLSVSTNFSERTSEGTELEQYIGVATTERAPVGYDVLRVRESDWAVFTVIGPFPQEVQDTWARIFSEWFPSSDYQLAEGPELLWHESSDLTQPDNRSEIWIPVEQMS